MVSLPNNHLRFSIVFKKNMCLCTQKLKFLDSYIAPGFSYSKYLAAYQIKELKGVFCYEFIDDLKKLDETDLPPLAAFTSTLRQTNISAEEHAECDRVWKANGMKTLKDFLRWYNNKDFVSFLDALEKQNFKRPYMSICLKMRSVYRVSHYGSSLWKRV